MKSHMAGIKTVLYCYLLAVFISWVSYPILIFLTFIIDLQISQSIYTLISTLVLCVLLYVLMHDVGFKDRRPTDGMRYETKGLVCGLAAFVLIVIFEVIIILLANRYVVVSHPVIAIPNINGYIRLILYMPFYWLYQLINPTSGVVPKVTYLTSLIPGIILLPVSYYGYYMGFKAKNLIGKDLDKLKNKIIYKGEKNK